MHGNYFAHLSVSKRSTRLQEMLAFPAFFFTKYKEIRASLSLDTPSFPRTKSTFGYAKSRPAGVRITFLRCTSKARPRGHANFPKGKITLTADFSLRRLNYLEVFFIVCINYGFLNKIKYIRYAAQSNTGVHIYYLRKGVAV